MTRRFNSLRTRVRGERGGVLIFVALGLPAFLLFGVFVVDVGNWWVHKRHLQVQADAAALAGAMAYRLPACNNNEIVAEAMKYSGAGVLWDTSPPSYATAASAFNAQLGKSSPAKVFAGINRPSVYGRESVVIDPELVGSPGPCQTGFVDVKVTEKDLPWFFNLAPNFLEELGFTDEEEDFDLGNPTPFIDARARVALKTLVGRKGALPLGVEDVAPKSAHVWIYDETATPGTAALLGQADLNVEPTPMGRLAIWSNSVTVNGTPITFSPHTQRMAVRIGLSGASTTDWTAADVCTRSLVLCYGYGVPSASPALHGVTRIRGVDTTGTGPPRVGDVDLFPVGCTDTSLPPGAENGYFSSSCTSLRAEVELVGASPTGTLRGRVTGMNGNQTNPLTFNSTTNRWVGTFPYDAATSAHILDLRYTQNGSGSPCPNNNTIPACSPSDVHSAFKGSRPVSGPLKLVRVDTTDATGYHTNDNNVPRCAAASSCPATFIVKIGLVGDLTLAQPGDNPISLRVFGGSQNQSLDCDPFSQLIPDTGQTKKPDLDDEIANGCTPGYVKNTGQQCPDHAGDLWAMAQPWNCVAIQTGTNANKPAQGLNRRVYGDPSPGGQCPVVGSNRYDQNGDGTADYPVDDKRIVPVFLVPFGTFDGSGNEVVPVTGFANFYVTGWTSNGNGFQNPCKNAGDKFELGTSGDSGAISGHFIVRVESTETGTAGETNCDATVIGSCVAVMTK